MGVFTRIAAAVLLVGAAWQPAAAVEVQEHTTPGGLTFWLVEEPAIPIVALEMSFAGGARTDPDDRAGVAGMMAALLDEGAGDLDTVAFAKARDAVSARFGFSAGRDRVEVSARMLADQVRPATDLLALALAAPRFDPAPVERVRGQVLSSIASGETDPETVAARAWDARAFAAHPYARPVEGTADSVAAITADDLRDAHARLLIREGAKIAVVGAIGPEAAADMIDRLLGGLPQGEPAPAPKAPDAPPPGVEVVPLDVPQSVAVIGQRGLRRDDPDFFAAYVMNHILGGGGFTSRLMEEVRVKRGLAYGVYSYLSVLDGVAQYRAGVQTANERMGESLAVIRAEWERLRREGVTAEELEAAKRYLTGAFPLRFDSNARIARFLVFAQEENLGRDYIDRRNALIEAVTLEDVNRVAASLLDPDSLSVVVVGQPAGL